MKRTRNHPATSLVQSISKMSDEPFIWVSEFDENALIDFYQKFIELEQSSDLPFILIIVSSYGGDVSALMAMRDLIKSSSKPVATIGLGKAMSCGACLLAAGSKGFRFASKDTAIMIHEVSGGAVGKTADITEQAVMMADLNRKLLSNLAKDSGKTLSEIEKKLRSKKNADWTMTANEAKDWGLIDHVALPRIVFPDAGGVMVKPDSYEESIKKIIGLQKKKLELPPKKKPKKKPNLR